MELFLWRHADALPGMLSDFERELSPLGHQQASKAAEWLHDHAEGNLRCGFAGPTVLSDMRILVSPAVRTRQTVSHFCEEDKIQLCQPLYDNASPKEILDLLGWPDIVLPALIVGHEPQISLLADRLLAGIPHPDSFRKGALWRLRLDPAQNKAELVSVMEV